jgi:hypothetical protein
LIFLPTFCAPPIQKISFLTPEKHNLQGVAGYSPRP